MFGKREYKVTSNHFFFLFRQGKRIFCYARSSCPEVQASWSAIFVKRGCGTGQFFRKNVFYRTTEQLLCFSVQLFILKCLVSTGFLSSSFKRFLLEEILLHSACSMQFYVKRLRQGYFFLDISKIVWLVIF